MESNFLNDFYPQKMNTLHLTPKKEELGGMGDLDLKQDMKSVMRQPENLSMKNAQASSQENIERFYDNLEEGLRMTRLINKQERIWNLDERGFSFMTMLQKVVSPKGAVTIYQQTTAEKS